MPVFDVSRVEDEGNARDTLVNDHGWSQEAVAKLGGPLATVVAAGKEMGLEGFDVPVVFSASSVPNLLEEIQSSDSRWDKYVDELSAETKDAQSDLERWLAERGFHVAVRLKFVNALALTINDVGLQDALLSETHQIDIAELDSAGELELDVGRVSVGIPEVYNDLDLDGEGQIIGVIDGEADPGHPALHGRVIQKANFSDSNWGDSGMVEDLAREHGTRVAGIIAGDGSGKSGPTPYVGMAPKATIWNYRIAPLKNRGAFVAAAIEQATIDKVRVSNLSWGQGKAKTDGSSVWSKTADIAFQKGMLLIKSNGNTGPAPNTLTAPADAHEVIAVGATRPDGSEVHEGSSRGPTEDGRSKPDVVAPGGGMTTPRSFDLYEPCLQPGTSFAAPVVSGIAALMMQARPDATPAQLRQAILESASPIAGLDLNTEGNGLVDAREACKKIQSMP